jgi:hypothetical protein
VYRVDGAGVNKRPRFGASFAPLASQDHALTADRGANGLHYVPMSDDNPPPPPPAGMLRCTVCGRTVTCTEADLTRYAESDWPECCGASMAISLLAESGEESPYWPVHPSQLR